MKLSRILIVSIVWIGKSSVGLVGLICFLVFPVYAESQGLGGDVEGAMVRVADRQEEGFSAVLERFAKADVLYLGETHDRAADHQAQLGIIRALYPQRPRLAIAMEMFQRPFQSVLDRYLRGELTEIELRDRTQYLERWGYSWEFYAPILRFAKAYKLPMIALNTPTEVTRKVSQKGLENLSIAERQWIPPNSAIQLAPEPYRQRIRRVYNEMHQGSSGSSPGFDRFFLAQVLWDETMAERIAQTLQHDPERLVVVLAGQGHIAYGEGIPNRVKRRLQGLRSRPIAQVSVLLNPEPEDTQIQANSAIADYFWVGTK